MAGSPTPASSSWGTKSTCRITRSVPIISAATCLRASCTASTGVLSVFPRSSSSAWSIRPRATRAIASGSGSSDFSHSGQFFRPHGWKLAETYSFLEEARRLRRETPLGRLWRLLGPLTPAGWREEILRLATAVLLERD